MLSPNRYTLFFTLVIISFRFFSQSYTAQNAWLSNDVNHYIDEWNIQSPSITLHSAFKPYILNQLNEFNDTCLSCRNFHLINLTFNKGVKKTSQYNVQVTPLINAQAGYDGLKKKFLSETSGGASVKLNINTNFTFSANLIGGNVSYPNFTDTFVNTYNIIPGLGRAYKTQNGYNYANLSGYASYSPNKTFNFQLGKDKHFIGDGYRSLLLSDVANNYPYFRINTNIWNLQYNVWYTWMQDIQQTNNFKNKPLNKFGTFHYLSWNATPSFNIAFFENVVWQGKDTNRTRSFDINYLNPVVFYRPQEYSLGSSDNSMIGLTVSAKLFKHVKLYGQVVADEFLLKEVRARKGWWGNKQGWQLGTKYINAFGIKNVTLQAEYNEVRPYTYTHGSVQQNYGHYGQALAHPLGANFREFLGFVSYRKTRWIVSVQGLYAIIGKDSSGINYGNNIFTSYATRPFEYGHKTTQGLKTTLLQSDIRWTYYLVPAMNLRLEVSYIQRSESNTKGRLRQTPFIYFGIKSSLSNFYRDF